jgi:hypothetical protein
MKSMYCFLLFVLLFSTLVACKPSEAAIQEALAQTQTAQTTNTFTPEPTSTHTPEPTLTPTFTPTVSPTPDTRVITVDSKELMLEKDDLPSEAKYYLPNYTWISPHHNSEIVSAWGVEEGTIYLQETGRIDGWWVDYLRGTNTVRAPEEIYQNIIQYESAEGAYLTLTEYNTRGDDPDYSLMDLNLSIGDVTFVYYWKEMQSSGEYRVKYAIESQYRNYVSIIVGWGWEKEFDLDYVIQIAEIAMDKIKAAPLGNW